MANLSGRGAPTDNTVGAAGDIYTNELSGVKYKCTGKVVISAYDDDRITYCWSTMPEETAGSGGGELVILQATASYEEDDDGSRFGDPEYTGTVEDARKAFESLANHRIQDVRLRFYYIADGSEVSGFLPVMKYIIDADRCAAYFRFRDSMVFYVAMYSDDTIIIAMHNNLY